MKTTTVKGKVETVLGQTLDKPIEFEIEVEQFETIDEAKNAGEWPNDGQILKIVNTKVANAARQNHVQKLTADARKAIEETPEFRLDSLVKKIMAENNKLSLEKATALAQSIIAMDA